VETFAVEESAELADGTPAAIAAAFSPRYAVTEADLGAIDADHWVIGDLRRA